MDIGKYFCFFIGIGKKNEIMNLLINDFEFDNFAN